MDQHENVYFITKIKGDIRKQNWHLDNKDTKIAIGEFVKLPFEQEEIVEHMWVTVSKESNGMFEGELDNDPYKISNIKIGDKVVFEFEDIEDLYLE